MIAGYVMISRHETVARLSARPGQPEVGRDDPIEVPP